MAKTAATSPHSPANLRLKDLKSPRNVRSYLPELVALISGGQTGIDQAALRAAVKLGLATGGYAPLGFRTLDGPRPDLGTEYGLVECWSANYASRTARNVFAADATIRIASNFDSNGERCTLKAIERYRKPHFDIRVEHLYSDPHFLVAIPELILFLAHHRVRILNVAGNSEQTAPGIGQAAEYFLILALGEPR